MRKTETRTPDGSAAGGPDGSGRSRLPHGGGAFRRAAVGPAGLLAVPDEDALVRVADELGCRGIPAVRFYEPDPAAAGGAPMGITAACTRPVARCERRALRRLPLWTPSHGVPSPGDNPSLSGCRPAARAP